jgi:hypothetical protein
VDVAGDTTLVPEALTIPMLWSILTISAPVTFHDRVDELSELRLLLKYVITAGALVAPSIELEPLLTGDCTAAGWAVAQPGMRIARTSNDNERTTNLFI